MRTARFEGRVRFDGLVDGLGNRRMRLLEDLVFVDPDGVLWVARTGRVVDGDGIPPGCRILVPGPLLARCRRAGVLHAVASEDRTKPSRDVHRMFYDALICDGVDHRTAVRCYAAVRLLGDRWNGGDLGPGEPGDAGEPALGRSEPRSEPPIDVIEDGLDVVLGE